MVREERALDAGGRKGGCRKGGESEVKCVEGNGRTRWRGRRNRDELEPKRELERTCLIEDRQKLRDGGRCRFSLCLIEQQSGASQEGHGRRIKRSAIRTNFLTKRLTCVGRTTTSLYRCLDAATRKSKDTRQKVLRVEAEEYGELDATWSMISRKTS